MRSWGPATDLLAIAAGGGARDTGVADTTVIGGRVGTGGRTAWVERAFSTVSLLWRSCRIMSSAWMRSSARPCSQMRCPTSSAPSNQHRRTDVTRHARRTSKREETLMVLLAAPRLLRDRALPPLHHADGEINLRRCSQRAHLPSQCTYGLLQLLDALGRSLVRRGGLLVLVDMFRAVLPGVPTWCFLTWGLSILQKSLTARG